MSESAPASSSSSKSAAPGASGRKPLLTDKPQGEVAVRSSARKWRLPARQPVAGQAQQGRLLGRALVFFGLIQVVILLGVGLWWRGFYQREIAPRLENSPAPVASGDVSGDLAKAREQITALQQQLDAQRDERERTQGRLQEMADRLALVIQQSSFVPTAGAQGAPETAAGQVAAMLPTVTPATSELVLLKERNRLASYGDQAIATGDRSALMALVEAMMDPGMKHLVHAAQAEFKRVQAFYDMGISIDPGYKLPVQELFKDPSIRSEADLTAAQLHQLLADVQQPWEARLRAAYLLRGSSDAETNARLLKALQEDPMLDVAKQAQITFENRVGRKFRLFDLPAIEAWWKAQGGDPKKTQP